VDEGGSGNPHRLDIALDHRTRLRMLLDKDNFFGTATKRFETQCARSGIKIEDHQTGPRQSCI
jgi:hypothetical protein